MNKHPRVELICVGSELLDGRVNTHAATLGARLSAIGVRIEREHTVGDEPRLMKEVFGEAFRRADVVITTGGLGPTFDDLTREAWAAVTRRRLRMDPAILSGIRARFTTRGIPMPGMNRRQGLLLSGATPIPNTVGTAPGQHLILGGRHLFLLPGPRDEMLPMLDGVLLPTLARVFGAVARVTKTFHLAGVPESVVDARIRPLIRQHKRIMGVPVVYRILAGAGEVEVGLSLYGRDAAGVDQAARHAAGLFRKRLAHWVFGEDGEALPTVVVRRLAETGKTVAVAESCTGGLLAKMITDVPGASGVFLEGIVSFANASKVRRMGVPLATIKARGAVSSEVARQMAAGIRRRAGADVGVAITGIAGPGGGTAGKPAGTVFIAVSTMRGTRVRRHLFPGGRDAVRRRAAIAALVMLRPGALS